VTTWLCVRRPLLLALFIGCGVSLMSSGRLTPRLVVDAMASFAFVPLVELAAFVLVHRRRSRRLPSALEVDRFFTTNTPWLLCIVALAALVSLQAPRDVGLSTVPPLVFAPLAAIVLTIAWSAHRDVQYFRQSMQQTTAAAARDAVLLRAIAWPAGAIYFVGIAIWPTVRLWVGQ
jgi:hypothetical protein